MKKFLAAVMAAAMVVSMTAVASFAKEAVVGTKAVMNFDLAGAVNNATDISMTVTVGGITSAAITIAASDTAAALATALVGTSNVFGATYITTKVGTTGIKVEAVANGVTALTAGDYAITTANALTTQPTSKSAVVTNGVTAAPATDFDLVVFDIIQTPLVEGTGDIVKDIVRPGKTIYFELGNNAQAMAEYDDLIKITLKKGDGSKNIESVKLVEKNFSTALTSVAVPSVAAPGTTGRQYFVAVKLKDMMKDAEYKINIDVKVTAKKAIAVNAMAPLLHGAIASGGTVSFGGIGTAWVNNETIAGSDLDFAAGQGGVVAKPVKDDNNTVTWSDANRDLATLVFTADSAVNVYYPKLSTAWNNEFYGMHFDADAFKFEFVGNPTISATARPVLSLMNPFINEDDEYTVDAADLIVYELVDGALVLVSDRFTATEDEDGNQVLVTKTRTLGTYVVTDAEAVMEAADVEVAPVTPEKPVPNTGR